MQEEIDVAYIHLHLGTCEEQLSVFYKIYNL